LQAVFGLVIIFKLTWKFVGTLEQTQAQYIVV